MALFSSNQPSIRARLLPRFPVQVLAGTGITITKNGGTYVFAMSPGNIPPSALTPIPAGSLLGRGVSAGSGVPEVVSASGGLTFAGSNLQMSANQRSRTLNAQFDPAAPGTFEDFYVATSVTIRRFVMLANAPGVVVADVWKTSFGGFPPTGANTICGGVATQPSMGTPGFPAQKLLMEGPALSAWNVNIVAGDTVRVVIGTLTGPITKLTIAVDVEVI